jgi:hypothetical protein
MTEQEYFQAIISLLMIGFLLFLVFIVWRSALVDGYRQSLFAVRDELFDKALQNEIAFDHPAYIYVRHSINQHIRFSHQHSVWLLLCFAYFYTKHKKLIDKEAETKWELAVADLDAPTREMLGYYKDKGSTIFLKYIWFFSPELLPIVLLGVILISPLALVGIPILTFQRFLIDSNEKAIDLQLCDL